MPRKQLTLKQLERAIARERRKVKTSEERAALERELKQLRAGTSTKFLRRLGRGFGILVKKGAKVTGRGIVRARKFAEESGAGEGLDVEFVSAAPPKRTKVIRVKPRRKKFRRVIVKGGRTREVFVPGLGTVTQRVQRKALRRAIKRKQKRRKIIRTRPVQDTGFFGSLPELDF